MNDLIDLRITARLTTQEAAELFRVDRRTWRRWENGTHGAPAAVYIALRLLCGYLDPLGAIGWRMLSGSLYGPEGLRYEINEIRALPLRYALIAELRRENRQLKQQLGIDNVKNREEIRIRHYNNVIPITKYRDD